MHTDTIGGQRGERPSRSDGTPIPRNGRPTADLKFAVNKICHDYSSGPLSEGSPTAAVELRF
jgi:hypothetical protein